MACLDTTLLVDLAGRGGRSLQRRAGRKVLELTAAGQILTTTRLNVGELWVGIERSLDPRRELKVVEGLLRPLVVLDLDQAAARTFGRIKAQLQAAGRMAGDMDVLIASVALVNGQTVVTRNPRHFSTIPGLTVETY